MSLEVNKFIKLLIKNLKFNQIFFNQDLEEKYRKTVSRYHTFKLKVSDQLKELIIFKREYESRAIENIAVECLQAFSFKGTY